MQVKLRFARGRLPLVALCLGTLGFVAGSLPDRARAADESWTPVTVIFTSDIKGQIEPCG